MASGPPLGMAASFAVLGGTTVTNTGATNIVGDVGVAPGTSITGFNPPGVISGGALHANDTLANEAEADLVTAYNYLAAEPVDTTLSGTDLGGLTLTPGVYKFATAAQLNGQLTLDAQGDPNAVFVFQIGTALTTATESSVVLINDAHAANVYWQVGSSATLGIDTSFQGSILAYTSIVMNTGASNSPGRDLAINGAVTLDTNTDSAVFTTPLTITADDQTNIYGDPLPTLTVSYSGFINGDTSASLTTQPMVTTTATSASHVAGSPYTITPSGATDPYYDITYVVGHLTVTQAPLTITADDQSKEYGAAVPTLTVSYAGFVNGDTSDSLEVQPSLTTMATAASHVAGSPYPITASGAVSDGDYLISYVGGNLTVTQAPLTITADDKNKVYGAALPTLTASYSGFVNGDTSDSLELPPTLTTTATVASHVAGSPYPITASGADSGGDYSISYVAGNLTVNPVALMITADDQSKEFGAAVPPLTVTYTGLVNGDTPATFSDDPNSPPSVTTTATTNSTVAGSPYTISVEGAIDPDYTIQNVDGNLVVLPLPVVSGTVYLDYNASGTQNVGEPGLAGRVVFLDLNNDGTLDVGDPTATTDANGNFTLTPTVAGTFAVVEALDQDASIRYAVDQTRIGTDGSVLIGVVPISPIAPVKVVPDPFSPTPSSDANTAYVQSLYHAVLGRVGGDAEVAPWLAEMSQGMTQQQVALDFVNSPEHREDQVYSYYEEFLHRAPDPTSVFWVDSLLAGVSEETITEAFLDSSEYQAAHQDSTTFIDDLYTDVLGRQGDPAGVAAWLADLSSGDTPETIVARFVNSPEAIGRIVQSDYSAFLHRLREQGTTSDGWDNMLLASGGSATDVAVGILVSPEYVQDATTAEI